MNDKQWMNAIDKALLKHGIKVRLDAVPGNEMALESIVDGLIATVIEQATKRCTFYEQRDEEWRTAINNGLVIKKVNAHLNTSPLNETNMAALFETVMFSRDIEWSRALGDAIRNKVPLLSVTIPGSLHQPSVNSFVDQLMLVSRHKPVIQRDGMTMVMDEYESPRAPGYAQGEPTACTMCRRPFSQHDRVIDAKPGERRIACPTPGYARVVIIAESAFWLIRVLNAQKDALIIERHNLLMQRGDNTTMYESMLENIENDLTQSNRWLDVLPERPA